MESNIWLSADHHFGHARIIEYCLRPFNSVWEMNNILTENWNALVKPEDKVYYLGDFSFEGDKYRKYLNGSISLVRGNHDKRRCDYVFDEVVSSMELKIGEFNCFLTHIPIELDRIYKKGTQPDFSLLDRYDYIIHAHIHQVHVVSGKNINIGIDAWNYRPINIKDLEKFLRKVKMENIQYLEKNNF